MSTDFILFPDEPEDDDLDDDDLDDDEFDEDDEDDEDEDEDEEEEEGYQLAPARERAARQLRPVS